MPARERGEGKYLARMEVSACFQEGPEVEPAPAPEGPEGPAEEDEPLTPYELTVGLSVGIRVLDDVPPDFVERWLEEGVQYLVFPYIRTTISDVLGRTGFKRPYFPLLAVPVLYAPDAGHHPACQEDGSAP